MYRRLEEELEKDRIGEVKVVTASVGGNMTNEAAFTNKEFGGIFIGVGVNMAYLAEVVFGRIKPQKINAVATFFDTGWHFNLQEGLRFKKIVKVQL